MNQANVTTPCEDLKTARKLLGAHVSEDLYWAFKQASAQRNETMAEAITHAAMMYLELAKEGN